MPHNVRKNAFAIDVLKKTDGSSLCHGRWDWNHFKLIRDNFSQKYTCCIEIYFPDSRYDNKFVISRVKYKHQLSGCQVDFKPISLFMGHTESVTRWYFKKYPKKVISGF